MFAHGDDPFIHRLHLICLAGLLQGAVVGHDAVNAVKLTLLREQVHLIFGQVLVSGFVRDQIDRIGEDAFNGKSGELLSVFGGVLVL